MSHFLNYVLIPGNTGDTSMKLSELLTPYEQGLRVESYEVKCPCVRYRAGHNTREAAALKFGPIETTQPQFNKQMAAESEAYRQAEWARWITERDEFVMSDFERQLQSIEPDPQCDECGGTGIVSSTYNENAKWDWWEVGGHWDGMLVEAWKNGSHPDLHGSVAALSELDLDKLPTPFAIVTPDGAWQAHGEMGWFARISKLDEDWEPRAKAILYQHQDCLVVVVDCHAA